MTPNEFKAWFDGFSESIDGAPSEKQWARMKARVAEIDGVPITYPVFVDRYAPYIRHHWPSIPYWAANAGPLVGSSVVSMNAKTSPQPLPPFDSLTAMRDTGRVEYMATA